MEDKGISPESLREIVSSGKVDDELLRRMLRAAYIAVIGNVDVTLNGLAVYSVLYELLAYREGAVVVSKRLRRQGQATHRLAAREEER